MVMGVSAVLIQTNVPQKNDGKERVTRKIKVMLVDMIVKLDSDTYRKHVVFENGK